MSELTISKVELIATIDAENVVDGLNNNDGLILPFMLEMLDRAGSSELEEELLLALQERLGVNKVEIRQTEPAPASNTYGHLMEDKP